MRSTPNWDVLKEPRGFIKIIELLIAIFAFACATGYRGSFKILQTLADGSKHPFEGKFKYPFNDPIQLQMMNASGNAYVEVMVKVDEKSSVEFFVVIGVFCFLYCVGMLVYYIMFQEDPRSQTVPTSGWLNPPVIDFLIGAFWAFFWFVSSCAQAAAVSGIKDATNAKDLANSLDLCKAPISCSVEKNSKYGTLTVSILFGFLNVFVWCGNMWFLWKETPFHQKRHQNMEAQPQPPQQHHQVPAANPI